MIRRYRLALRQPFDVTAPPRFTAPAPAPPAEAPFLLLVVNQSDLSIVAVRVDGGSWARLRAPIGRTCDEGDAACIAGQGYAPLVGLPGSGSHDVEVELVDGAGQRLRSVLSGYTPPPGFRSGVVLLGP